MARSAVMCVALGIALLVMFNLYLQAVHSGAGSSTLPSEMQPVAGGGGGGGGGGGSQRVPRVVTADDDDRKPGRAPPPPPPRTITITVEYGSGTVPIRLAPSSSEQMVREAVAVATGLPVGACVLKSSDGTIVGMLPELFKDQAVYKAVLLPEKCPPANPEPCKPDSRPAGAAAAAVAPADGSCIPLEPRASDAGLILSPYPVKVKRKKNE